jgi:hypothetical protein
MAYTKPLVYGSILPRGGGTGDGGVLTTVSLRTVDGWYIENGREGRWAAWRCLPHIRLFTCEPQSGRYSSDMGELTSQRHQPLYCWVRCCARYLVHRQASCCDVKPANMGALDHFSLGQLELRPHYRLPSIISEYSPKSSVGYGDAVLCFQLRTRHSPATTQVRWSS